MASVKKRVRDGKTTFVVRWRDPAGQQHKRSFVRRSDAERHLTSVSHNLLTGGYVDPAAGRLTVGEYAGTWLARQVHLKPSTRATYAVLLRRHVLTTFGDLPLARVERSAVVAWIVDLAGSGLSASTIRQTHRVFYMILGSAVADGRIVRNVAAGVPLPRPRTSEKRFLDHGQVSALADAAGPYAAVVRVLAYCGLRFGELAALRVGRVDLMRRRIEVVESATEVNGEMMFGTPKSSHRRSVPVPRSLVDELAVQCAGKAADAFVFTAPEGGVLWLRNFRRRVFDPAAQAAGLAGLTPHELRHTAASLAVAAGANVKAVQRMLGHASAAMTLDVYAGLFDDDLDAVADRLDAAARDSVAPRVRPEATVISITERNTGL